MMIIFNLKIEIGDWSKSSIPNPQKNKFMLQKLIKIINKIYIFD